MKTAVILKIKSHSSCKVTWKRFSYSIVTLDLGGNVNAYDKMDVHKVLIKLCTELYKIIQKKVSSRLGAYITTTKAI